MKYSEHQPAEPLAQWIECFWILQGEISEFAQPERILPDGCMELILNFADRFCELRMDGTRERQPQAFVVGQMECPMWIAPTGRVDLIGVRFQPWGAAPFLQLPLSELSGRVEELEAICLGAAGKAWEHVSGCGNSRSRIAWLEQALLREVRNWKRSDCVVECASRHVLRAGGVVSVSALAKESGLSIRQLERRFESQVGLGPKRLARIVRFQQVFRALENETNGGWADVAIECGYYDQAHLIRDFQRYAGAPPTRLESARKLTEVFLRKNRMSQFSKHDALDLA
jgi:AraC-like DNA-binding protein